MLETSLTIIVIVSFIFLVCTLIISALILEELNGNLHKLVKLLGLRKPGLVRLNFWQGENGMLKFVLVMPPVGAADVVKRHLTVSVGSSDPMVLELAADAVESSVLEGEDGYAVVGSLVDEDDVGNKSEAREFSFVLVDTIAPPQPGEMGLKVVEEV